MYVSKYIVGPEQNQSILHIFVICVDGQEVNMDISRGIKSNEARDVNRTHLERALNATQRKSSSFCRKLEAIVELQTEYRNDQICV